MRRMAFFATIMLSLSFALVKPEPVAASVAIGVSLTFHDSLSPYGDWIDNSRFGVVWVPRHVDHGWRPYSRGRWVYTDDGWTWISDENWGWATYHYGRWHFDPDDGWEWIPGNQWAPAWVSWRSGGGYVGWAPLPPEVDVFRAGFEVNIDPFAYSFVEERRLCDHAVYRQFAPAARNVTFVNTTQNITAYAVVDHRVVNRGLEVQHFEHASGRAVPRLQIREVASASEARGGRVQRGQVAFFRPAVSARRVTPEPNARALAQPRAQATRPDQLVRQQEKERQQLQTAQRRERDQLQKIHKREDRHPPPLTEGSGHHEVASERRGAPAAHTPATPKDSAQLQAHHEAEQKTQDRAQVQARHEAEQKAQDHAQVQARHDAEQKAQDRAQLQARHDAEQKAQDRAQLQARHDAEQKAQDRAQLQARHEAEQKAQAEQHQRESHVLEQRQERERRAVQAPPPKEPTEKPTKSAAKRDHP